MSTESAPAKKRASAASPKCTSEDDHRRKRRNRPTQSCLNCHTSKRMCDRQRPCGRCTQLGLTGLCVYEVDNPSHRANAQDEAARLQKRVAELESIIRELKNKPHPRWAQPGGSAGTNAGSATNNAAGENPGPSDPSTTKVGQSAASFSVSPKPPARTRNSTPSSPSSTLGGTSSPSSCPPGFGTPSPLATPSPEAHSPSMPYTSSGSDMFSSMLNPDDELSLLLSSCQTATNDSAADGYLNDMLETLLTTPDACSGDHSQDHCGCLNEHTEYNTVLELSLRLRRATEILSQYAKHGAQSDCKVHRRIAELDRFTTTALGNVITPPEPLSSHPSTPPVVATAPFGHPAHPRVRPTHNVPAQSLAPHALQSPRAWDFKQGQAQSYPSPPWDDSFMSWEPLRQPSEWPQGL
ncbi:hypothetical protein BD414DRAFT_412762 [Trametes punicea]|nr:hypothetical protein BD414DRAFT_412762 [Trametes punicea]